MKDERERGFLLMDVLIVTAIVAIAVASAGTFYLGNLTPAVAAATIDVNAAIDETRTAAMAMDAATVVFSSGDAGRGFSVRVYERVPGDPRFLPRNGPAHESATASVSESAAPLGTPGFALSMDRRGNVTGYKNFGPSDTVFTRVVCPAANTFRLTIGDGRETRTVTVPCALALTTTGALTVATPQAALVQTPQPAGTCPATSPCTPAPLVPGSAACPSGYTPDATAPGLCDPASAPTCPPGSTGLPPACTPPIGATPTPLPLFDVAIAGCGSVKTSDVQSVSALQHDSDGMPFVTYADASGIVQTHLCIGHADG
jgi:hypothetical protein